MSTSGRDLLRWDECARDFLAGGPKYQIAYELQLFRSRWRLAWLFQTFNAPEFNDATVDGYSAAFRVFLAYTAHEQLAKSIGEKHNFISFEDRDLAHRVRDGLPTLEALTRAHATGKQHAGLEEFWNGRSDDIRFFAYGIRSLVGRGPFTANKVKTKSAQRTLTDVADVAEPILLISEQFFGSVLDQLQAETSS